MWQHLRIALLGTLFGLSPFALPVDGQMPWSTSQALAGGDDPPPPPPLDDGELGPGTEDTPPPEETGGGVPPEDAATVEPLNPGEAVVTRFSSVIEQPDGEGQPVRVIDVNGISASIIDIRRPGQPPSGQHWIDEPQRLFVTAGEVGQVFGVALADTGDKTPDIFLSASAAFGLHRIGQAPGATDWMPGMWGPGAGPGSIYRISPEGGFLAEKFADVTLDGRANTGAALGNIAYDSRNRQLFVTDLETGMIHSLDAATGEDLGRFDHGVEARPGFQDVWAGKSMALAPVSFNPATAARTGSCASDFSKTPECWNIADFRRRVWGVDVRQEADGATRLYYSTWGSDAFGNAEWAAAGDDRRNAVWSVAITGKGKFGKGSVRREFFLPAFWPSVPEFGDRAGNGNAVAGIAFPGCGQQNIMLVAERGGLRNLGLGKAEPFARPHEARVLRYELDPGGIWRPKGRYDVGFHDRSIKDGPPQVFASAAGGASFGYRLNEDGTIDRSSPSQSVWMTGDGLCSADGPCTDLNSGEHRDASEVHGLQGSPATVLVPVEPNSQPALGSLDRSYMIDADINIDAGGAPVALELARNDATRIGSVAVHQVCDAPEPLPIIDEPDGETLPPIEPPGDWPVHTLDQSHEKWASAGHNRERSWHRRDGSWHAVDRSWHWRNQSYHSRNQTWHWREGSWHTKAKSWHRKGRSLHGRDFSWHDRDRSWHLRNRSYHSKNRTWDGSHIKGRTWGGQHIKNRTWGDHIKGRSFHQKGRTWGNDHVKGKSYHVKDRTWSGDHVKGRTYHRKDRTWGDGGNPQHVKGRTFHRKDRTFGEDPRHVKGRTFHQKGKTFELPPPPEHAKSRSGEDNQQRHVKGKTFHQKGKTFDGGRPEHARQKSLDDRKPKHDRKKSRAGNDGGDQPPLPGHRKGKSFHQKGSSKFVQSS